MSDHSEHLISMAGGEGEPDKLAAIEARAEAYANHGTPGLAAPADRAYLLARVREQAAKLDALRELADGWKPPSENADLNDTQVWYSFAKHHAAQAIRNIVDA